MLGFFDEVIGRLPVPSARAALRAAVTAKIDAHRGTEVVV